MPANIVVNPLLRLVTWKDMSLSIADRRRIPAKIVVNPLLRMVA